MRRPLDPLRSIKVKLGVVVVVTVAVTMLAVGAGWRVGVPWKYGVPAATLLALGLIQLLAHGMTSPLREMARAAAAMQRGDYGRRVVATSGDEVGDLARAFNAMAADLAEIDRLRRDLVANVSHELRTPISALQAVLENLVDGVEPPDPDTLQTMLRQVERLGRLVEQLLDLSRLESGAVPLQRQRFALGPLIEEVVAESRLTANGVQLDVGVDPAGLAIDGDPERLHQVIANVVENAVRHSPQDGRVAVRAWREAESGRGGAVPTVTIEVADEGPGIADEDSARVFERFYRADPSRSSAGGGAGLGLALARWIVDLHGGEIRPEKRDPHGCRMVVVLPGGSQ